VLCVFAIVQVILQVVDAYRTGAGTCYAITEDINPMSFSFYDDAYGNTYPILLPNVTTYTPGQILSIQVTGGPDPQLKGILLYATTGRVNDSRVGTFTNLTSKYRILDCGLGNSTVTHSNRNRMNLPTFDWIAPPTGTGQVTFYSAISVGPLGDSSLWTTLTPVSLQEDTGSVSVLLSSSTGEIGIANATQSSTGVLSSTTPATGTAHATGSSTGVHIPPGTTGHIGHNGTITAKSTASNLSFSWFLICCLCFTLTLALFIMA